MKKKTNHKTEHVQNVNRFDVYWVNLDPTMGAEIKKTRPCVIISPNEMNHYLSTVIVAPLTSTIRHYPTRVFIQFQEKAGSIALDQLRTVDKKRLVDYMGTLDNPTREQISSVLLEMFC